MLIMTMLTTLRMLTGDEVASDGSASILGHQLDSDRRTFLSQIGYCPQFDSIIPQVIWRCDGMWLWLYEAAKTFTLTLTL